MPHPRLRSLSPLARARSRSLVSRAGLAAAVLVAALTSAAPAPAAPAAPGQVPPPPADPVPEGFRAQSLTWVSPERGWVLGTAPCLIGGDALADCTTAARTSDGGVTWSAAGTVDEPIAPSGEPGVTEIDFSGPRYGWAYGPSLQATGDGGRTWAAEPLPGGNRQVLALVADGSQAHAVFTECPLDQSGCTTPPTLWRKDVSTVPSPWQPVPGVELPPGSSPVLAAHGRTTYVIGRPFDPGPGVLYHSGDGESFSPRPSPCDESAGETLTDVAPTSRRDVALLCVGDPGFSKATKRAFRSTDTGRTTTPAGSASVWGIVTELAATPGGTLAMSTYSSGSAIYLNDTGGTTWTTPVDRADGGAGWNDIAFTDGSTAWVVYSPVSGHPGSGIVMASHDGGRTWADVPLTPP